MSQESLRTEQSHRKVFVDKDIILEWRDIATIIDGLPSSSTNMEHLQSTGYVSKSNGGGKTTNTCGVTVAELVGRWMSATTVDDSAKDVSVLEGGLTEYFGRCTDAAMDDGQILRSELFGAELALVWSESTKAIGSFQFCGQLKWNWSMRHNLI